MKKPKDKIIRKFLNKKGHYTTASVLAMCEYDDSNSYMTLIISDCKGKVNLDLSAFNKKDLGNVKFKLKILKESIEMLEEELEVCLAWVKFNEGKADL